jgi:helicase
LLGAAADVAELFDEDAAPAVNRLSLRVQHGAKEELLGLLELKGLGRYRARQLYKHGFKSKADLKEASADQLTQIRGLGPTVVERVKEQLGQQVEPMPDPEETEREGQLALGHFDD